MSNLVNVDYIGTLVSSGTAGGFKIQTYKLNPGIFGTFPWGYISASQYVNYRVKGCKFLFQPTVGDAVYSAASNPAMGYVGMRFQNDPTVPQDSTLFEVQNNHQFVTGAVYKPLSMTCLPSDTRILAIRGNSQPSNTDLRNYDFGYIEIFSNGLPAASVTLGTLHVSYQFELYNPITKGGITGNSLLTFEMENDVGVSTADPFGTAADQTIVTDNIGITVSNKVITFPASITYGKFMIILNWYTTSASDFAFKPATDMTWSNPITFIQITGENIYRASVPTSSTALVAVKTCSVTYIASFNNPGQYACTIDFTNLFGASTTMNGTKAVYMYIVPCGNVGYLL